MTKLLFVCTGNTCRSAMAEGICNAMAARRGLSLRAASCGVAAFAGDPPPDNAVTAAADYGADLSAHRARPVQPYLLNEADAIYCMTRGHLSCLTAICPEAAEKMRLLSGEDIADPWGGSLADYRAAAEEIAAAVSQILDRHMEGEA